LGAGSGLRARLRGGLGAGGRGRLGTGSGGLLLRRSRLFFGRHSYLEIIRSSLVTILFLWGLTSWSAHPAVSVAEVVRLQMRSEVSRLQLQASWLLPVHSLLGTVILVVVLV